MSEFRARTAPLSRALPASGSGDRLVLVSRRAVDLVRVASALCLG